MAINVIIHHFKYGEAKSESQARCLKSNSWDKAMLESDLACSLYPHAVLCIYESWKSKVGKKNSRSKQINRLTIL